MHDTDQQADPITLVISEVVAPDRIPEYEAWTKGINQAAKQFDGFMGVEIIRPRDHTYSEYVVIVKFDNYAHSRAWLTSSTYQNWMSQARGLISARSHQQLPSGLELWFTLPKNAPQKLPHPAYYKQVILGVLGVYPLILLANAVLGSLLQGLPSLVGLLISVTFVSALLTYPVMPWLSKVLSFWLYPSLTKRSPSKRSSQNSQQP
jgi:uncharacterized protein